MTPAPCQFLPWDTDFFGVRIGRVIGNRLTPDRVRDIDAWSAAEHIACLYFLADRDDSTTTRLAENHGYRMVDLRLTLEHRLPSPPTPSDGKQKVPPYAVGRYLGWGGGDTLIRPVRPDDIPALEAIARVSYTDSRFYFDPCFPRERCDALYARWIRQSSERSGTPQTDAEMVWVADLNGLPQGYISGACHATMGSIGLVGVADSARGGGIGMALVQTALTWFADQGMSAVQVVTQGRNLGA
ncbi:MAG: GNAT family N-acetyltransferase, partial [Armatimonadetes bacterium]|nr:GNAT family N-acetyltransferase [Anaerolineae bacterium]